MTPLEKLERVLKDLPTEREQRRYWGQLSRALLSHKYRYYIQDSPICSDFEYDFIEKLYDLLSVHLELEPIVSNMVGFDIKRPHLAALARSLERDDPARKRWEAQTRTTPKERQRKKRNG